MAFVLALDPVVVGAALAQHHAGFGDGLQFLEKIVQFPRWLPEPTEAARVAIAKRELAQYMPALDAATLRQEFALLPSNPRELQTMLRGLWGLQAQLPRYAEGEINWRLLLRITALRYRFRKEMDALLQDAARLDQVAFAARFLAIEAKRAKQKWVNPSESIAPKVNDLPQEIVAALAADDMSWDGRKIIEHAMLVECPVALTKFEFAQIFDCYSGEWSHAERDVKLQQALHAAADARRATHATTTKLTIQHALAMHHGLMDSAMQAISEAMLRDQATACGHLLRLLSVVLFDDRRILIDADIFHALFKTFLRRARLTASLAYVPLRRLEREILEKVCAIAEDPGALLEILKPWDPYEEDVAQDDGLRAALVAALQSRIEPTFLDHFDQPNAMTTMLSGNQRSAERWCLLRHGVVSRPENLTGIGQLTSDAAGANGFRLLKACTDQGEGTTWYGLEELPELAKDIAITDALWQTATRSTINVRFFASFQTVRAAIERMRNAPLADPPWWADVSAAYARLREP